MRLFNKLVLSSATMLVIAGLSGCATAPPPAPQPTPQPVMDPVLVSIAQSAQVIRATTEEMARVNSAAKAPDITPNRKAQMDAQSLAVPPGLGVPISISHDGLFTTLVEAVAKGAGWNYIVEGNQPPVIQVVHKTYNHVRAVDILRDIGYSVHGATIVLDPVNRVVIVRF